jgi:hypothetical protein
MNNRLPRAEGRLFSQLDVGSGKKFAPQMLTAIPETQPKPTINN